MIYIILFIVIVCLTMATIYFFYNHFKPLIKSTEGRKNILKAFLILALLSGAMYALVFYLQTTPAYFAQGIEQLHSNRYIKNHINGFNNYSYNSDSLIKDPSSPATFKVELENDGLALYLTCTMKKEKDRWLLSKIHQDSVVKK